MPHQQLRLWRWPTVQTLPPSPRFRLVGDRAGDPVRPRHRGPPKGQAVFGLLPAEYLPANLLTPMATGLGVSEALAGHAVSRPNAEKNLLSTHKPS